jgi:hypothetical protein
MVHKDVGLRGVRGDLILQRERLIFRPEIRGARPDILGETVFPLDRIRKVSRSKRTPVLSLKHDVEGLPETVFFYFVRPPDMYSSGAANPRSAAGLYLANSNALYDEEVTLWVDELRQAVKGARA